MQWHIEGKYCCADCFQYPWLVSFIRERSDRVGECQYCGKQEATLIAVGALSGKFANLMKLYTPSEDLRGDPLPYLFQDHWSLFADGFSETDECADLINDIMMGWWDDDDGDFPVNATDYYVRVKADVGLSDQLDEFLQSCTAGTNPRFTVPDFISEDIWRYEGRIAAGTVLYRARIGYSRRRRKVALRRYQRDGGKPEGESVPS